MGSTLANFFCDRHIVHVNDTDPAKNKASKKELMCLCDVIFVCVPTPVKDGRFDLSLLEAVIQELISCKVTL